MKEPTAPPENNQDEICDPPVAVKSRPGFKKWSHRNAHREEDLRQWKMGVGHDLRDAWVSICPESKEVVSQWRLEEIVDYITGGSTMTLDYRDYGKSYEIAEIQRRTRQLYDEGAAEAREINEATITKLLTEMNLEARVEDVKPVLVQPKKKKKEFFISKIKWQGKAYDCPDERRYHRPKDLGKEKAKRVKETMPGAIFAGVFQPKRTVTNMGRHTGLYVQDLDDLQDIEEVEIRIRADSSVFAEFMSISGKGVKVLVRGPVANSAAAYEKNYRQIAKLKGEEWGVTAAVDTVTCDCSRLCYLAYDPEIYVNWDAVAITHEELAAVPSEPVIEDAPAKAHKSISEHRPVNKHTTSNNGPVDVFKIDWSQAGEVPDMEWKDPKGKGIPLATVLDALRYNDPVERESWRKSGAALKLGYGEEAFPFWDYWASMAGDTYKGIDDCRKTWDSHDRGEGESASTPLSILKLAYANGWKGKRQEERQEAESEEERQERLKEEALSYPDLSLVECSVAKIDPNDTLLGNRFLCRGGGAGFIGGTGIGKSSALVSAAILWSVGREAFGIKPARALNIMMVQAENDQGDLREMSEPIIKAMKLTEEERKRVHQNTTVISINDLAGIDFVWVLESLIEKYRPDLAILDPFNAYLGSDPSDAAQVIAFCRRMLNPILARNRCGLIICHHTPKTRTWDTAKWKIQDWSHAGAGASDLANWARAMLVLDPTHDPAVFKLIVPKRGRRLGWTDDFEEPVAIKYFTHGKNEILWRPSTPEEIARAEKADRDKRGGARQKYSDAEILRPLAKAASGLSLAEHWQALHQNGCKIAKTTLNDRLADLVANGRVEEVDGRAFLACGNQLPHEEHSKHTQHNE